MTTLVIMRHAKADPDGLSDHERPLLPRGTEQAREAGQWLASLGLAFDCSIVSSSVRTQQTLTGLGVAVPQSNIDLAYNAPASQLAELVRSLADSCQCIVLIAHNPGVSDLAASCGHNRPMKPACAVVVTWGGSPSDFGATDLVMTGHFEPTS